MKDYTTAVKRATGKPVKFTVDGRPITFKRQDTSALFAAALVIDDTMDYLKARYDWFAAGLSDEDAQWFQDRLTDPADPFTPKELWDIINDLVEEIGGHPTQPADG